MNNGNKWLSCEEANDLDMVDYFSALGFLPKRVSGHQYWYLSPFRNERTASFKINRNINCWYDFGEGKGGTVIDFGIRYFNCSVYEFLQQLFLFPTPSCQPLDNRVTTEEKESQIEVTEVKTITSFSLRNYLKERKIDCDIANAFCKEVPFRMNDKNYFALGFANDAGGYELRNSFFKGSTHPKDITSIENNGINISFFEGFFDFLSYKTMMKKTECVTEDYCILNSLSFLNRVKDIITQYPSARIFFDRDKSGTKATAELIQLNRRATDESHLYQSNKDLNEWLMQFGLSPKHSLHKSHKKAP